jgi:hypothetical protein
MVKRFIERFQIWCKQRAAEFEDKFLAWLLFFGVLFIGQDAYTLISTHHLQWSAVLSTALVLAFIVLYIRRWRWTWVPLMLVAVGFIASTPLAYTSAAPRAPVQLRVLSAALILGFGVVALIYSFAIRKRFARDI